MRSSVTLLLCGLFFAPLLTVAEVIHLKNGRTIWADQVRQTATHVEYDLGDNTYKIPKSVVDRVEAGGLPPEYSAPRARNAADVPAFVPAGSMQTETVLVAKVIHEGRVDPETLSKLSSQEGAVGHFVAGRHEFEHGNFAKARQYFEAALRFEPDNPTVLNYYASLLVRTGNAGEALPYAQRAVQAAPDSPDTLDVLGYAQYAANRTQDAVRTWKRSLQLRPDTTIQKFLDKAQRDATAEANFSEHESSHFSLRYEGKQVSDSLRRELVATLEFAYDDLVRQLGITPRGSIAVILYANQAYFDVTHAPAWSGAVNDGKLRIPIEGLTSVNSELARVLKHELTHSFINQVSAGRCPQWLHEGIAQAMEPKSLSSNGRRLAAIFAAQHQVPYNALEGSFMRFSGIEAMLAYDESLAAAQYIVDTYGVSDLQRILALLGQGSSTEAALRATIHSDYGQMETDIGKYLTDKYGS